MSLADIKITMLDICLFVENGARKLGFRCSPWAIETKRGSMQPLEFTLQDCEGEEYQVIVRHLPRVEHFTPERNVVEFPAHRASMPPNPRSPHPFSPRPAA